MFASSHLEDDDWVKPDIVGLRRLWHDRISAQDCRNFLWIMNESDMMMAVTDCATENITEKAKLGPDVW